MKRKKLLVHFLNFFFNVNYKFYIGSDAHNFVLLIGQFHSDIKDMNLFYNNTSYYVYCSNKVKENAVKRKKKIREFPTYFLNFSFQRT